MQIYIHDKNKFLFLYLCFILSKIVSWFSMCWNTTFLKWNGSDVRCKCCCWSLPCAAVDAGNRNTVPSLDDEGWAICYFARHVWNAKCKDNELLKQKMESILEFNNKLKFWPNLFTCPAFPLCGDALTFIPLCITRIAWMMHKAPTKL